MEDKKIDKYDVLASISSGTLTAALDVFWVKDISLADAHKWGKDETDEFIKKVAKSKGYKGNEVSGAIKKLEDEYPFIGDEFTAGFGGGSAHHLRDFSHHPTPVGLMFSILSQFTGKGYGTDTSGKFVVIELNDWKRDSWEKCVYKGTIGWIFHLISDIAGSSSTRSVSTKEGTGIPGPVMSLLKEFSAIPGVRQLSGKYVNPSNEKIADDLYSFPVYCSKLFDGTLLAGHDENGKIIKDEILRFDLRTELGIVHESITSKQYIPVALNMLIVSAFYSVRNFMNEMKEKQISSFEDLKQIDIKKCLPWGSDRLKHMRMIAASTFSTIDISVAGIKAAVKNKDNPSGFAIDFIQGMNVWGLGNLAITSSSEAGLLMKKFSNMAEQQKEKLLQKVPDGKEIADTAKQAIETAGAVLGMGTPIGFVSATMGVYKMISDSVNEYIEAKAERIEVEKVCAERIALLREYCDSIESVTSEYLTNNLSVFNEAFGIIDKSIEENDVNSFIAGNNMIQNQLCHDVQFDSQDDFDAIMLADDKFVL